MKRTALLLLILLCAASTALAKDNLEFCHEALSVHTKEELAALAERYDITVRDVDGMPRTFLCDGIYIGDVDATQADVALGTDVPSRPYVYFRLRDEDAGITSEPGHLYHAVLASLTARYGKPHFTAEGLRNRADIWLFDRMVIEFQMGEQGPNDPEGKPYLLLEYAHNAPDLGDPPIPDKGAPIPPPRARTEDPALTADVYFDRLEILAQANGLSISPICTQVEVGDTTYFSGEFGAMSFLLTTDTATHTIRTAFLEMPSDTTSVLGYYALSHSAQDEPIEASTAAFGKMLVEADTQYAYREGPYAYSTYYIEEKDRFMVQVMMR